MQLELLEKNRDADVRVYAVWFSMYPTDMKERWPADVLADARVVHFWDEQKSVGRWYMERIDGMSATLAPDSKGVAGPILWDAYLVYGPESVWSDAPSGLRRWGRTIVGTREPFRESFHALLARPGSR